MSATPQQNAPAHVARYEELRGHAAKRQLLSVRFGLAVLLRQGLAAWVEQGSKMPAPTQAPSAEIARPSALPHDTSADLINVLAAMALGHVRENHA